MGCGDAFLFVERKVNEGIIRWWEETPVSWVSQGKGGKKERKGMKGTDGHLCPLCLQLPRLRLEASVPWRPSHRHPVPTHSRQGHRLCAFSLIFAMRPRGEQRRSFSEKPGVAPSPGSTEPGCPAHPGAQSSIEIPVSAWN